MISPDLTSKGEISMSKDMKLKLYSQSKTNFITTLQENNTDMHGEATLYMLPYLEIKERYPKVTLPV